MRVILSVFDETIEDIYLHQKETLEDSLKGRNVVVSSGTGSGKTESFLLPIFSKLLEESKNWEGSSPAGDHWWESDNSGWVAQREKETGRKAANEFDLELASRMHTAEKCALKAVGRIS